MKLFLTVTLGIAGVIGITVLIGCAADDIRNRWYAWRGKRPL